MMDCCGSPSYRRVFSPRMARWAAGRYSRRGLSWGPRRTLDLYKTGVIGGESLLEIGGGIGDLQVELLTAGVDRAVSVELSPSYEDKAAELLRDAGLEGRTTRLVGDFVTMSTELEPADLVVMHSVICCYPDMEALVGIAAEKTKRYLVASYPLDIWWTRPVAAVQNAWYRHVRRTSFRFYIHPPARIHEVAATRGLSLSHEEQRMVDHVVVLERSGRDERRNPL